MSTALAKVIPLDPEFQAVYDAEVCEPETPASLPTPPMPRVKKLKSSEGADDGQALLEMAQDNAQYSRRKEFREGSFDQVQHDVSNAGRLLFNFLTR
jgi:hypothetical protein